MRRSASLAISLAVSLLAPFPGSAGAHALVPTEATLLLAPAELELRITAAWHLLAADAVDGADEAVADRYLEASLALQGDARAAFLDRVREWLKDRLTITCDGHPAVLRITLVDLEGPVPVPFDEAQGAPPTLRFSVATRLPVVTPGGKTNACTVRLAEVFGATVLHVQRPPNPASEVRLLGAGVASPPIALHDRGPPAGSLSPPAPPAPPSGSEGLATIGLALAVILSGGGLWAWLRARRRRRPSS